MTPLAPAHAGEGMDGVYVASRVKHAAKWLALRSQGFKIVSSWIDESDVGQTVDFSELWTRIHNEVAGAKALVLYVEPDDFPLKGALIEAGMAFGQKPIMVCAPGVIFDGRTMRPIGSWVLHRSVQRIDNLREALYAALHPSLSPPPSPFPLTPGG